MRSCPRAFPAAALALVAAASLPCVAQAQVYKCKTADGHTSYQSSPCPDSKPPAALAAAAPAPAPTRSSEPYDDPYAPQNASRRPTLVPPPVARSRDDGPAPRAATTSTGRTTTATPPMTDRERLAQYERDRNAQALQQDVARLKAQERSNECAHAQQQLGVNREERPIYHYDANGNKVYTEDKDRARSLANAQQRVGQACN